MKRRDFATRGAAGIAALTALPTPSIEATPSRTICSPSFVHRRDGDRRRRVLLLHVDRLAEIMRG